MYHRSAIYCLAPLSFHYIDFVAGDHQPDVGTTAITSIISVYVLQEYFSVRKYSRFSARFARVLLSPDFPYSSTVSVVSAFPTAIRAVAIVAPSLAEAAAFMAHQRLPLIRQYHRYHHHRLKQQHRQFSCHCYTTAASAVAAAVAADLGLGLDEPSRRLCPDH